MEVNQLLDRIRNVQNASIPESAETYRQALRYFVKYVAPDSARMDEISALIHDEERRLNEWAKQRAEILQRQKTRQKGRKELASVLRLVSGGNGQEEEFSDDETKNKRELEHFDLKVYQQAVSLEASQRQQLRELGVPLFVKAQESLLTNDQKELVQFLLDLCQ